MIVKSMTPEEVYNEIEKDLPNVEAWWRDVRKKVSRFALKLTKFPRAKWYEYKSHRLNRYIFRAFLYDRKTLFTMILALQKADRGYAVYVTKLSWQNRTNKFAVLPHVFDRYAQRVGVKKEGVELVKHFFERNFHGEPSKDNMLSGKSVRYKGRDNLCLSMQEGVALGEMIDGIFVAHTFITYDMATGLQREEFERKRDGMPTDEEWLDTLVQTC